MEFKERTLSQIADMICGNTEVATFFRYRSSSFLTDFFRDCGTNYKHDNSLRAAWVANTLRKILAEPHANANTPPETFSRVICTLMDQGDATINEGPDRPGALKLLNAALAREDFEAFYAPDKKCYLRRLDTNMVVMTSPNPHRPFSAAELEKREQLIAYLNNASEDEIIEEILVPLFRQLGFRRVTVSGHEDKALEYGKDIWMKYTLPTEHVLYFGIQAKKGKIDSSGNSKATNVNVAEIHNQVTMLLGCEIFDSEISKRVFVDHAYIVAGGVITKAARNWLGSKLDSSKRSQIMFMDRDDILKLFVVTNLPIPRLQSLDDDSPS